MVSLLSFGRGNGNGSLSFFPRFFLSHFHFTLARFFLPNGRNASNRKKRSFFEHFFPTNRRTTNPEAARLSSGKKRGEKVSYGSSFSPSNGEKKKQKCRKTRKATPGFFNFQLRNGDTNTDIRKRFKVTLFFIICFCSEKLFLRPVYVFVCLRGFFPGLFFSLLTDSPSLFHARCII